MLFFSVCLSARLIKKLQTDFDKFFGAVMRGPRNNKVDFGGNPYHDPPYPHCNAHTEANVTDR